MYRFNFIKIIVLSPQLEELGNFKWLILLWARARGAQGRCVNIIMSSSGRRWELQFTHSL